MPPSAAYASQDTDFFNSPTIRRASDLRRSTSAISSRSTPSFSAALTMISSSTYTNPRRSETRRPTSSPPAPVVREMQIRGFVNAIAASGGAPPPLTLKDACRACQSPGLASPSEAATCSLDRPPRTRKQRGGQVELECVARNERIEAELECLFQTRVQHH